MIVVSVEDLVDRLDFGARWVEEDKKASESSPRQIGRDILGQEHPATSKINEDQSFQRR